MPKSARPACASDLASLLRKMTSFNYHSIITVYYSYLRQPGATILALKTKNTEITSGRKVQISSILTVLVNQHAEADSTHVEAIEEILDTSLNRNVIFWWEMFFHFHYSFSHCLNNSVVSVSSHVQQFVKSANQFKALQSATSLDLHSTKYDHKTCWIKLTAISVFVTLQKHFSDWQNQLLSTP